jgi:outer membrane protein
MVYRRMIALFSCVLFVARGSAVAADLAAPAQKMALATQQPASNNLGSPKSSAESVGTQVPETATGAMPIAAGGQLTLRQAIAIALEYHPRIRAAMDNTTAATMQIGEAQSYLGPQVFGLAQDIGSSTNGIANTTYYDFNSEFPRMTGRNHNLASDDFSQSSQASNSYMGGFSVSQFLFDFGRRRGFVAERRSEAASVAADEQFAKLELIFEVSQRYFGVLEAKELVRVYEKAVEQRQFHLHEAQVKADAGLRPQLDVYVTQAELERAQLHLLDEQNAYADAKLALNNSLGLSDRAPEYHLADNLSYSPITETIQPLTATAIRLRPDLKALDHQARALGAQIVQYKSDYYPTVYGVGGYSAMGTGLPAANNYNAGVVITWPLFNSFLTTNQIAEAKARQQAVAEGIEDLRQQIILQVQSAFLNWQTAFQRIQRAEKALAASSAQLELAEKRYEAGLADIVELEDAQRFYTYDDAAYANALYGFSVAKAAVDQATGRSLSGF